MKKIRVLQIGCDNIGYGGRSMAIYNLTQNMESDNIQNDFLYFGNKVPFQCEKNIRMKGGHIIDIGNAHINKPFVIREYKKYKLIRQVIKKGRYDIVHINADNAYEAMKSIIIARSAGIKHFIIHAHTTGTTRHLNQIQLGIILLCKKILMCTTLYQKIACSIEAAEYMFGTSDNTLILKNGILIEQFMFNQTKRNEMRLNLHLQNKYIIGCVGRLTQSKNILFLLDIFAHIHAKDKNTVLMLVGEGEQRNDIERKVDLLNLNKDVILLGNRLDVPNILQSMDIFVMPSLYEGLGIVNIEAQAASLPCIVSNKVPDEAHLTDLFMKISLDKSAEYWADFILNILNMKQARVDRSDEIRIAGYDIKSSSKKLQEIYINMLNR